MGEKMLKFINKHSLNDLMLATNPNKSSCVTLAGDILTTIDNHKRLQKVMSGGNALNGNKLRTFRQYKTVLKTEFYVKQTMSRGHRRVLAKFCSCNLPLAIETGRNTRPKTPVFERFCTYCYANSVEDETHSLVDCEFYSDLSYELFQSSLRINLLVTL